MAFSQKRVDKNKDQFKQYYDEKLEPNPRRHVFWAVNRDDDSTTGHPVLGHQILGMILDDKHDFEYIGRNGAASTKERIKELSQAHQEPAIEAGKRIAMEKLGYVEEADIPESQESATTRKVQPAPKPNTDSNEDAKG